MALTICDYPKYVPTVAFDEAQGGQNFSSVNLKSLDGELGRLEKQNIPVCSVTVPVKQAITKDLLPLLSIGKLKDPLSGTTMSYKAFLYKYVDAIIYARRLKFGGGDILGASLIKWDKGSFWETIHKQYGKVVLLDTYFESMKTPTPALVLLPTLMEEVAHNYIHEMVRKGKLDPINNVPALDEYNAKTFKLQVLVRMEQLYGKAFSPAVSMLKKELLGMKAKILREFKEKIQDSSLAKLRASDGYTFVAFKAK